MCVCVRERGVTEKECVCECLCERERGGDGGERHSLIEVTEKECVCVCVREREGGWRRETFNDRGDKERECVCV